MTVITGSEQEDGSRRPGQTVPSLLGTQAVDEDGQLTIGRCRVDDLAHRYGTPLYVIDETAVRDRCREFVGAFREALPGSDVTFGSKACPIGAFLRVVVAEGLGVDVASEGELLVALRAGVPGDRITMHGNNKSADEMRRAVEAAVAYVVIDSEPEITALSSVARDLGRKQPVLVRVNPGVTVDTDQKIRTGVVESKFGLPIWDRSAERALGEVLRYGELVLDGVHFHLGSQIMNPRPFCEAIRRVSELLDTVRSRIGWVARRVVVGGGMGVRYSSDDHPATPREWADSIAGAVREHLHPVVTDALEIGVEPGRLIAAEAGTTLYTVGPVKPVYPSQGTAFHFVTVDGGLADNPRPILYGARHDLLLARDLLGTRTMQVRLAGHHCETDTLVPWAVLPPVRPGDVIAMQCTGAYTYAMASNYNRYPRPAVVFVRDGISTLAVRRETIEDVLRTDVVASAETAITEFS